MVPANTIMLRTSPHSTSASEDTVGVPAHLINREMSNIVHQTVRFGAVGGLGVQALQEPPVCQIVTGIFPGLHFCVDLDTATERKSRYAVFSNKR